MKQTKQRMYEAPKVELIEMETQGVLCASVGLEFDGSVMAFDREIIDNVTWSNN